MPVVVRVLQLLMSPIETVRALADARKADPALRELGLESTRMATGDCSRYGLGRGGWVRRLRTPVGFVLTASRGPAPPSLLQTAIERAQDAARVRLRPVSTNVFESGKVVVDLRGSGGEEFFMRLAAGPSRRPLEASVDAVNALAARNAPELVRDRLVVPLARGSVGPLHYSLEPSARGSHPWRMTSELWDQSLEFLIELFGVDANDAMPAEASPRAQGERMADYVSAEDRQALPSIVAEVERRLADVPRGQSHGDYWSENFLVRDGQLDTVLLDWEWSARDALPLIDLFDLIALSRRRVKDLTPGERFTEVLWPRLCARAATSASSSTAALSVSRPTSRRSRAWRSPTGSTGSPASSTCSRCSSSARLGRAQPARADPAAGRGGLVMERLPVVGAGEQPLAAREAADSAGRRHGRPAERAAADDHGLDPGIAVGEAPLYESPPRRKRYSRSPSSKAERIVWASSTKPTECSSQSGSRPDW